MSSDSLVGAVVDGRYVITGRLAHGGMATVYRARDKRLERDVALKLMHPHLAENAEFTERFNREARAAARLTSAFVVTVHDQGVWDAGHGRQSYLVMEYVPGPDLRSELARLGSFNLGTALAIAEQTLRALSAAHSAGIVHRDVKPENVMLSSALPSVSVFERPEINAKVADFGLARAATSIATATGQVMGTVAYLAPEVIMTGVAEAPADVYSVGIMLYEFLTGRLPFQADTPIATAYMHINDPMPLVGQEADWLPETIDPFIGLLTAKDPSQRPADGETALRELLKVSRALPEEDLLRRIPVIPQPIDASPGDEDDLDAAAPATSAPNATTPVPVPATTQLYGDLTPADAGRSPSDASRAPWEPRQEPQAGPAPFDTDPAPWEAEQAPGAGSSPFAASPPADSTAPMTPQTAPLFSPGGPPAGHAVPGVAQGLASPAAPDNPSAGYSAPGSLPAGAAMPPAAAATPEGWGAAESRIAAEGWAIPEGQTLPEGHAAPGGWSPPEGWAPPDGHAALASHAAPGSHTMAEGHVPPDGQGEAATPIRQETTVLASARPRRRRLIVTLACIALVALIATAVGFWYFRAGPGMRRQVPDVAGQTYEQATSKLKSSGLKAQRQEAYSDTVPAGSVISTTPKAGQKIHPSRTVSVTVSLGIEQVTVPDVVGKTSDEAEQLLNAERLTPKTEQAYSDDVPEGSVIEQSVAANTEVDHHTEVTITVSLGREPATVPDVVGKKESAARSAITKEGLKVEREEAYSDSVDEGLVISQTPEQGTAYKNDTVTITISKGPEKVEIPDVVGMSRSDARSTLEEAGFTVEEEDVLGGYFDRVQGQTPGSGHEVAKGTTVTISVM